MTRPSLPTVSVTFEDGRTVDIAVTVWRDTTSPKRNRLGAPPTFEPDWSQILPDHDVETYLTASGRAYYARVNDRR